MSRRNPEFDKVFTDEILTKICNLVNVTFHHCDTYAEPVDKHYDRRLEKAICIVYSSQYGHWTLALNSDGSIVLPFNAYEECEKLYKSLLLVTKSGSK